MIIRPAEETDLPIFLGFGRDMIEESKTIFPPIEPDRFRQFLALTISHPTHAMAALAIDDGERVGMVTAFAGDYAWSTERRSVCDALYVLPERRGGSAAYRLIEHFEHWADWAGAKTAIMGVSTGINPERTGKFYQRLGYDVMGMTYRKSI